MYSVADKCAAELYGSLCTPMNINELACAICLRKVN